jgi:hypothetical protein
MKNQDRGYAAQHAKNMQTNRHIHANLELAWNRGIWELGHLLGQAPWVRLQPGVKMGWTLHKMILVFLLLLWFLLCGRLII